MNDRWHPAPQSLIDDAISQRWSKDNPAPELVGFMVVFARINTPHPWTARKLADWAGWSRWKANQTINAAKDWANAWNSNSGHSSQPASGHQNATTAQTYEPKPATFQPLSGHFPDIARADLQVQNKTEHRSSLPNGRSPDCSAIGFPVSGSCDLEDVDSAGLAVPDGGTGTAAPGTKAATSKRRKKAPRIDYGAVWDYLEGIRIANTPNAKETAIGRRKTELRLRIGEHGEEKIKHAWRWLFESNHERARFLRQNGHATYSTFLRASKCQQYVDFAQAWNPDDRAHQLEKVDLFNLGPEAFDADGNLIDF